MWCWLHMYKPPRRHEVNDVNASLCTHLVYNGALGVYNGTVIEALRDKSEVAQYVLITFNT